MLRKLIDSYYDKWGRPPLIDPKTLEEMQRLAEELKKKESRLYTPKECFVSMMDKLNKLNNMNNMNNMNNRLVV